MLGWVFFSVFASPGLMVQRKAISSGESYKAEMPKFLDNLQPHFSVTMIFVKLAFFPLTVLTEERWVMKSSWGGERERRSLLLFFKLTVIASILFREVCS